MGLRTWGVLKHASDRARKGSKEKREVRAPVQIADVDKSATESGDSGGHLKLGDHFGLS
jgi:hypothetical protein